MSRPKTLGAKLQDFVVTARNGCTVVHQRRGGASYLKCGRYLWSGTSYKPVEEQEYGFCKGGCFTDIEIERIMGKREMQFAVFHEPTQNVGTFIAHSAVQAIEFAAEEWDVTGDLYAALLNDVYKVERKALVVTKKK